MICEYTSVDKVGQTRVGFSCSRILLGESRAEIYQLKAHIGDAQGYAGLSGEVNSRFWEKYGSAILTTGIGTAVEAAVPAPRKSTVRIPTLSPMACPVPARTLEPSLRPSWRTQWILNQSSG